MVRDVLIRLAVRSASRPARLGDRASGAGLRSRLGPGELGRRLEAVDLVAADIDECLFPGFSQTYLGFLTFAQISRRPEQRADRALLPQLLSGGLYIRKVALLHRLHRTPHNAQLMARYEQSMMGVPRAYFDAGAATIPALSFPGALSVLARLSHRAVVGTVSFGIHPIARAYVQALQRHNPAGRFFAEANRIRFEPGPDGRTRFAGYERPLRTDPAQKGRILEERLARHRAATPLVFGNGRDEAAMAEVARGRGGLSVGIDPLPEDADLFDVVLRGPSWRPLLRLLRAAHPAGAIRAVCGGGVLPP